MKKVLPLIQHVCGTISREVDDQLLCKIWTFGQCQIKVVLEKQQWDKLLLYFEAPFNLGFGLDVLKAMQIRTTTTLAPDKWDDVERE